MTTINILPDDMTMHIDATHQKKLALCREYGFSMEAFDYLLQIAKDSKNVVVNGVTHKQ